MLKNISATWVLLTLTKLSDKMPRIVNSIPGNGSRTFAKAFHSDTLKIFDILQRGQEEVP